MNVNICNLAGDASLGIVGPGVCSLGDSAAYWTPGGCFVDLFPFEPGKPADFQIIDQSGML